MMQNYTIPQGYEFPALTAVRPLMLVNQSAPDYPGLRGSSTLLTINSKYFIACTGHQFGLAVGDEAINSAGLSPLFVSHREDKSLEVFALQSCHIATDGGHDEYHDIRIFEADDKTVIALNEATDFFQLERFENERRTQSLMIGCPQQYCSMTYDPISVSFATQGVVCEFDQEFNSNSRFLRRFKYVPGGAANVDGFSGGAIFSLFEGGAEMAKVRFDGIVTRAGNGFVYVVDANFLLGLARRL
jgi:hypothetical protein